MAAVLAAGATAAPAPSAAAPPDVPTERGAPWPSMRHDRLNTGRSPIRARYHEGDRPWAFVTRKGIFSTPIVGRDETVYAGSADTYFYAVGPGGRLRWRYKTGEIIDSAGVLGRGGTVTFGSGDERVYRLRSRPAGLSRRQRAIWRFRASRPPAQGQLVNWWEGNVTMGPGGVLYAGNTGGAEYAINPNGRRRWLFPTGNSVWSNAAIGDDGSVYFGSLDLIDLRGRRARAAALEAPHRAASSPRRRRSAPAARSTWAASTAPCTRSTRGPATTAGATPRATTSTPRPRWASGASTSRRPTARSTPSTCAACCAGATTPATRSAPRPCWAAPRAATGASSTWARPTASSTRSTPAPAGAAGPSTPPRATRCCATATTSTPRPRWGAAACTSAASTAGWCSCPTTGACAPAATGAATAARARPSAPSLARMAFVTPGGNTRLAGPPGPLPAATALTTRLLVRQVGETVDAGLDPAPRVTADPPFEFSAEPSGDGHFLHVVPSGLLDPGRSYELRIEDGWSGARPQRRGGEHDPLPHRSRAAPRARRCASDAARLRLPPEPAGRAAAADPPEPQPDRLRLLRHGRGRARGERRPRGERAAVGAVSTKRGRGGRLVADRKGAFSFPLQGRYRDDSLLLSQRGLSLTFSFGDVPMRRFDLRMQLGADRRARGASLYAEVFCPEVPNYGPALIAIGLCNRDLKLPAERHLHHPALPRPGEPAPAPAQPRRSPAPAPAGRSARRGHGACFAGASLRASIPPPCCSPTPAAATWWRSTTARPSRSASATATSPIVRLSLPAGTELPARMRVHVIADVFPLAARTL